MIRIVYHDRDQTIRVESPYSADFVQRARALGGRWDRGARVWTFDAGAEEPVRQALRDVYGTDGGSEVAPEATTTLYVYASRERSEYRQPIALTEGLMLARAYGRDSGAKLGTGVAHLRGEEPTSGGSHKNWQTVIPAGCLLAVYQVPRGVADRALASSAFVVLEGTAAESPEQMLVRARAIHAEREIPAAEAALRQALAARHRPDQFRPFAEQRNVVRLAVRRLRALRDARLAPAFLEC